MTQLYVALDFNEAQQALDFAKGLDPAQCGVKVGLELFCSAGSDVVRELVARGFPVFLDLKFHDIPNTVAGAVRAATALGVTMLNVHAAGGVPMMEGAKKACTETANRLGLAAPTLIGVTIMTSLSAEDCRAVGYESPESQTLKLAHLVKQAGLDGVVCSGQEAASLQAALGPDFHLCTPGIRPAGGATHDQQRIVTPKQAVIAGAHSIVVGRAITQSADPAAAVSAILQELNAG